MAESERPLAQDEVTCVVRGQEIQLIGIQVEIRRFENTIHIELFHPLLIGLPPDLAADIVHAVAIACGRPRSNRVSFARSERKPINPLSIAELRQLLDQL